MQTLKNYAKYNFPGLVTALIVLGAGWAFDSMEIAYFYLGMSAFLDSSRLKILVSELEEKLKETEK